MKFLLAFAAILAVASAQFSGLGRQLSRLAPQPLRPTSRPVTPSPQPVRIVPRPVTPNRPISPLPRPTVPGQTVTVNRVSNNDQNANIIRYVNDIRPDGSYNYAFETDNGISAQAQGTPRDFGGNPPIIPVVASGSFAWTSPEGQPIAISYIADENGYQPSGDAIPTPHPIPEAIARSIEYNLRNQQ